MARHYSSTQNHLATSLVTEVPFSLGVTFRLGSFTGFSQYLLSLYSSTDGSQYCFTRIDPSTSKIGILASGVGGSNNARASTPTINTGQWYRGVLAAYSDNTREFFLDGVSILQDLTTFHYGALDRIFIGGADSGESTDIDIAHCAVWNNVSAAEIAAYSAGFSPISQFPVALKHYYPLWGRATSEEDWVSGKSATVSGSPTVTTAQPLFIFRSQPRMIGLGAPTVKYRPGTLITASGWTDQSGAAGSALVNAVNEVGPDDSNYDKSALNPSGDVLELQFLNVQPPQTNTNHVVRYRIKGDASTSVVVRLIAGDGSTVVKTWTHSPAPNGFSTFEQALTTGEANTWAAAGYPGSRLRVTAG